LGNLFVNETGRLHVALAPAQSYTNQDTLFVSIQGNPYDGLDNYIKVPGPFDSVVIVQATIDVSQLYGGTTYGQEGKGYIRWWLNEHPPMYEDWFYVRGCSYEDSITLELP